MMHFSNQLELIKKLKLNKDDVNKLLMSDFISLELKKNKNVLKEDFSYRGILKHIKNIEFMEFKDLKKEIRLIKNNIFLKIAFNIILDRFSYDEKTYLMSFFAEKIIKKVLSEISKDLKEDLVVFSMGKLGGYELNFSSDVDLVVFYDGLKEKEYLKITKELKNIFSDYTEEGFCLRIDYDLRPGGKLSNTCHSLNEAINYYQGWANTWERIAWLKSRFIFGNKKKALDFLEKIKPFVFKKYLDYTTIEEVRSIKHMIDEEAYIENIKLGKGGIRELEFSVNSMFLIFSGRFKAMRKFSLSYIEMIDLLVKHNFISKKNDKLLKENYIFLRNIEFIMHSITNRQVYELNKNILNKILKIKNDYTLDEFKKIKKENYYFFNSLFKEEEKKEVKSEVLLFKNSLKRDKFLETLNIKNLKEFKKSLDFLHDILDLKYFNKETKKAARVVILLFLDLILKEKNKEELVLKLKNFINSIKTRPALFSLLKENESLSKVFMQILKSKKYFYEMILNYPEYIDVLVLGKEKGLSSLLDSFNSFFSNSKTLEEKLEAIKLFKVYEELRLGMFGFFKDFKKVEIKRSLTKVADIIITNLLKIVSKNTKGLCLLCLGSYGEKELNFGSDLDLVFIYDEKNVKKEEAIKIFKKLISFLTSSTRYGKLYSVDMDLRPSGKVGPLVVSFSDFLNYYNEKAKFWEFIAFLKSRFLSLDKKMLKKITKEKYKILKNIKVKKEDIIELKKTRNLFLEKYANKSKFHLKYSKGSLIDIEYTLRLFQLINKKIHILKTKNIPYFLKKDNKLDILKEAYEFYQNLEIKAKVNNNNFDSYVYDGSLNQEISYWSNEVDSIYKYYMEKVF
jgi:[glutamine synthetase] adenylyltransferase / [glutamine synthetase]-adenylyl-L-tyrosine phosphorylase